MSLLKNRTVSAGEATAIAHDGDIVAMSGFSASARRMNGSLPSTSNSGSATRGRWRTSQWSSPLSPATQQAA